MCSTTSGPKGAACQEGKATEEFILMERQATDDKPAILSVIVVSDYAAGEEKSWEDLRRALRAWVDQEGAPADV